MTNLCANSVRILRPLANMGRLSLSFLMLFWLGNVAWAEAKTNSEPPRLIGATATVVEVSSGLPFPARVDTGAKTCSIHCEAIKIKDPAPEPKDNIGKPVRILLKEPDGKKQWIKTKIADYVTVRTSKHDDDRYKVPLKLRFEDVEKKVLVTLNDREKMKYPMLLGRNFLKGDFLVDVDLEYEKKKSNSDTN